MLTSELGWHSLRYPVSVFITQVMIGQGIQNAHSCTSKWFLRQDWVGICRSSRTVVRIEAVAVSGLDACRTVAGVARCRTPVINGVPVRGGHVQGGYKKSMHNGEGGAGG